MAQKPVEVILIRQLATYLAMPVFIVDDTGTLVFYNEPAEVILGRRFDETGEMPATEWTTVFTPTDDEGRPLPPEKVPLAKAAVDGRPTYSALWIRGLDGVRRHLDAVAFPLLGHGGRHLGAVAIFWETPPCA